MTLALIWEITEAVILVGVLVALSVAAASEKIDLTDRSEDQ